MRGFKVKNNWPAEDVLAWALSSFHPRIAIACSFQHAVLIDMAVKIRPDVRVFSIDTARLPKETHECAREFEEFFGIKIEWYLPDHRKVEQLVNEKGSFSFQENIEARQECCRIRKIDPLNRALGTMDAWITGLRRDQSDRRKEVNKVEEDLNHNHILKINPLADWKHEQIRQYIKDHQLPYNRLFERGYTSIGCACCTRPVDPGSDPRSGRWWWEDEGKKECGLHVRNWNI